ncbi:Na+/H+ antiporter [Chitinasiproducens palmae]|uniref:Sodium/proton antiporter, CPA1 family n=1 Tax=Chitinasiproducens palmae TaxID=1770053 RepID=A0A1H2PQH3_9BURK|nr:Na+/H+ antiporter [Chitinasiproducens palmae]SDV48648.1 sodium/proton antiporter, CPA1 family [Chitinasiproducens palmae]
MEIVYTVLILLLSVALSGVLFRLVPFTIPLPLVQIFIGALLAWPGFDVRLTFDPDLFMLLFIPPLLFADAWRIPKRELFAHRRAVLMLALGLVFFTIAGAGYFVHWLVPAIPLPIAFALAAVLSPTDAVALSGIVGKKRLPAQLMHVLEGEALLNDASGLVALRFAIKAALTGVFSIWAAAGSFVLIACGGLAVGAAFAWLFNRVRQRIGRLTGGDDAGTQVLLILLMPFAAYLLAEHLGLSGILSAVAAGMMMNYSVDPENYSVATRMRGSSVWAMIELTFNGIIFIMLGQQFPAIIGRALVDAHRTDPAQEWALVGEVVAVFAALFVLRFVWVWLLRWLSSKTLLRAGFKSAIPGMRTAAITSFAGVRGAITLAGVLSLPFMMPDGSPLPARDTVIFLASGVILLSLVSAAIALPLLLRHERPRGEDRQTREERDTRTRLAQAAVEAIEREHKSLAKQIESEEGDTSLLADVAAQVATVYRRPLQAHSETEELRERALAAAHFSTQMHIAALHAERMLLFKLRSSNEINDETLEKLLHEADLAETAIASRTLMQS